MSATCYFVLFLPPFIGPPPLLLPICLPQAINPIELGTVALQEILRRFYADFPTHLEESKYNYVVSSSMKPTQVTC